MRLSSFFCWLLLLQACRSPKPLPATVRQFNSLPGQGTIIIISCIKCGCIIEAMNEYFENKAFNPAAFTVYGDTTCTRELSKSIPVTHIPQQYMDSCSVDFYNMLVRKKNGDVFEYKQVSTREADNLPAFLDN